MEVMEVAHRAWSFLFEFTGQFEGVGVNHEGEDFKGNFEMKTAIPDKLLLLESSARGNSGETFHEELSWIGWDISGSLTLYVSSNNHPGVTPHVFSRMEESAESKKIIFRFGQPEDKNSFREEITFALFTDGSLAHHYAWGLPGGEFRARSGARMKKVK